MKAYAHGTVAGFAGGVWCRGCGLVAVALLAWGGGAQGATFTVTTLADRGPGSLREAIESANAHPGRDVIRFAVPDGGGIIPLESVLPAVTEAVELDGSSQPGATANAASDGFDAVLAVELAGAGLAPGANGLVLAASDCEVAGLAITGFGGAEDGSGGAAIVIDGALGCVVRGCSLGVDRTGSPDGNAFGVWVRGGARHRVGGLLPADRNWISANSSAGIRLQSEGLPVERNEVLGNLIGTDASGKGALPNGGPGIWVADSSGNRLGGGIPGEANRIAFNAGHGVFVSSGERNRIQGNWIHDNGGLGIELGEGEHAGPDQLDDLDADTGANGQLNAPILRAAVIESEGLALAGSVFSRPNSLYTVEVFTNAACDPSGYGEGAQLVAGFEVWTDDNGEGGFEPVVPGAFHDRLRVTATTTDEFGNTSEFSACQAVTLDLAAYSDLAVEVEAEGTPVAVGGEVTLHLRVEDRTEPANPDADGLASALSVSWPPGLELAAIPEGAEANGRSVVWSGLSVPAGGVWETSVNLRAAVLGTFVVTAAIVDAGPRRSNDQQTVRVEALPANTAVLRVADVSLVEGAEDGWLFPMTIELSAPAAERVTFEYRTVAGTALPGEDYRAVSGVSGMLPGETSATVYLPIRGDSVAELTESFELALSEVSGAFLERAKASVTIEDDDEPVRLVSDLGLTITAVPEVLTVATNVVFSLAVTNSGPDAVVSARLTSELSEGLRLVAASGGLSVVTNSAGAQFDLGGIAPGEEVRVEVVAETLRLGGVIHWAQLALVPPPVGSPLVEQTDPNPENDAVEFTTDVLPAVGPQIESLAGPALNPQTGLQEQTVRFVNLDFEPWPAVRLVILGLPPSVVVYNASGITEQEPFVQYDHPVEPGGSVVFVLEYYRADRQPVEGPEFAAEAVDPFTPGNPGGTAVPTIPSRGPAILATGLNEGRFLIEFRSEPGERYVVQFRPDLGTPWRTALPLIQAPSDVVQWFDDGPPKTPAPPAEVANRFYRVLKLDAPQSEIQP